MSPVLGVQRVLRKDLSRPELQVTVQDQLSHLPFLRPRVPSCKWDICNRPSDPRVGVTNSTPTEPGRDRQTKRMGEATVAVLSMGTATSQLRHSPECPGLPISQEKPDIWMFVPNVLIG